MPYQPRTNFGNNAAISTAGFGHVGYCRMCSLVDPVIQKGFDQRISAGWKAPQLQDWLKTNTDQTVNRQTIYKHIKHVQNPKDRMVTAVARRQQQGFLPQKVSDEAFLEAITSVGYSRVQSNPDEVTIDHALRAVQIKTQAKSSGNNWQITLINVLTDRPSAPQVTVIEGEAMEVSP